MKQYKTVIKPTEVNELEKCTCDKCGIECDISNENVPKYAQVAIYPQWGETLSSYMYLCPTCTLELMRFFEKADTKEKIEDMEFWLEDED
jgi:hypothetical protein